MAAGNWKLAGAVEDCTVRSWDAAAGDDPDLSYGELLVVVELSLHLGEDGLGPTGPHHSWAAVSALVDQLKTIQGGSEYWTNLEERVFTRSWLPDDDACPSMPYLSVVLELPEGSFLFNEGSIVRDVFRINVIGWVPENTESHAETTAVEAALKLKDDIIKALM